MTDQQQTHDRAVQALIDNGWIAHYGRTITLDNLTEAVALVLRVIRDDYVMANLNGELSSIIGVERYLNRRVEALTGSAMTGDTTTPGFAGYPAEEHS